MSTTLTAAAAIHTDAITTLGGEAMLWRSRRSLPTGLTEYANELLAGSFFNVRVRVAVADVASALDRRLAHAGLDDRPERRSLVSDIAALAEIVADAVGCDHVVVRVEHDPGAMCPVFHQDRNIVRLLCTYAGPGTEWLIEQHLDRSQLGLRGRTPTEANLAIARGTPERAQPGEVLIIKGTDFDTGHPNGVVHKSPDPALGDRLLVAVDPADLVALPRSIPLRSSSRPRPRATPSHR